MCVEYYIALLGCFVGLAGVVYGVIVYQYMLRKLDKLTSNPWSDIPRDEHGRFTKCEGKADE